MPYRPLRRSPDLVLSAVGRRELLARAADRVGPTLSAAARLYRATLVRSTRVVAVVGSFGKTTAARAIIASLGLPHRHIGLNSITWVAIGVLRIRPGQPHAVIEAGEKRVFEMECARLLAAERADLARKVRWVSKEDGDGAGYDIRSFDAGGAERLIEVKTTNGGAKTPFFLTRNEKALADERPEAFRLYRVFEFAQAPRLFTLEAPLERALVLDVGTWRAGFG